ncbi:hypothetical protein BKA01_005032 [Pseudonocardia eucalypti]|nr:hypothetical protein [Pseudonocardia eucalypti]
MATAEMAAATSGGIGGHRFVVTMADQMATVSVTKL